MRPKKKKKNMQVVNKEELTLEKGKMTKLHPAVMVVEKVGIKGVG